MTKNVKSLRSLKFFRKITMLQLNLKINEAVQRMQKDYPAPEGPIRSLRSKNLRSLRFSIIARTRIKLPLDPKINEEVRRETRSLVTPSRTNTTLEVQKSKVFKVCKNFQDDNIASTRRKDQGRSPKNVKKLYSSP